MTETQITDDAALLQEIATKRKLRAAMLAEANELARCTTDFLCRNKEYATEEKHGLCKLGVFFFNLEKNMYEPKLWQDIILLDKPHPDPDEKKKKKPATKTKATDETKEET